MSHLRTWSCLAVVITSLVLPARAWAQQGPPPPPPPAPLYYSSPAQEEEPEESPESEQPEEPARGTRDAPLLPPDPGSLRTEPQPPLTENGVPPAAVTTTPPIAQEGGVLLDGRPRQGPFLSGTGSLTFVLHHTILGAMGGLFTQGFARDFNFDRGSREAMLAGTLIGAGLGFGASAWWQFNNWVDRPLGYFGIANSVVGGMFMGGFMDLVSNDRDVLAWSSFIGAELGAWLTAIIGGGQLPLNHGLLVSSGAGWGLAYSALLLAIIHFSGSKIAGKTWADTLLMAPGIGAGVLAVATMRYNPTSGQILRADAFGAGVGAIVLLISGLVLGGFDQPTPYVLSFLGSAGAITTVSLLWEESVDRTAVSSSHAKRRPDKIVWW